MIIDSTHFRNHRCFKDEWAGFDEVRPVNVIIGRNNTGKSHLLDLVAALCDGSIAKRGWRLHCRGVLDEASLRQNFAQGTSGGELEGNHWEDHGRHFVGATMSWEIDEGGEPKEVSFGQGFDHKSRFGERSTNTRLSNLRGVAKKGAPRLVGSTFRRLLADRDINPEPAANELILSPSGTGATNIIRRLLVTSHPDYPYTLISRDLLDALNTIFGSDGRFTEIQIKHHDDPATGGPAGTWEVFLGEEGKTLVPLRHSGSGLKTILLVLLNLLVVPKLEKKAASQFVFAFEELENNLHPALLRRLLRYVERYCIAQPATVFLTTHASVALDLFAVSPVAQILHVTHDGVTARTKPVPLHFDRLAVISELGAKPSDLLQANGIVWVEGPSDRIYLNRWLDIASNGDLREGTDYQCAFYGGSLLGRTGFQAPEEEDVERANLLRLNPNIVVVCDSDRPNSEAPLKPRVQRIVAEVGRIPDAIVWVTAVREIENYIPGTLLAQSAGIADLPDPGQYEAFFPRDQDEGLSFCESKMQTKRLDKIELARSCAPQMNREVMSPRFDWLDRVTAIVERINAWNR